MSFLTTPVIIIDESPVDELCESFANLSISDDSFMDTTYDDPDDSSFFITSDMDETADSFIFTRQQIKKSTKTKMVKRYQLQRNGVKICPCGRVLNEKNKKKYDIANMEAGHCIPHTTCGENDVLNLRPICTQCNRGKGGMHTKNMFVYYRKMQRSGQKVFIPKIWVDDYNVYCTQNGYKTIGYDICKDFIREQSQFKVGY